MTQIVHWAYQGYDNSPGRRYAVGLAEYRAGLYRLAIMNNTELGVLEAIPGRLVRAMAQYRVGDFAAAEATMNAVRPLIKQQLSKQPGDPEQLFAGYWVTVHALSREAEELLAAPLSSDSDIGKDASEAKPPGC